LATKSIPTYFSCLSHNTSKQQPKPLESFEVACKLKNIGSAGAANVKVSIVADTSVSVAQPIEFVYESVGAGQEIAPVWTLSARDQFKPYIYYQIEVTANGMEKRVFQFNKSIESSDTLNPVAESGPITALEISSVFPNPTNGSVSVSYYSPECSALSISVFDVFGTKLFTNNCQTVSSGANRVSINLADYPEGVYFLRIDGCGSSATRKIIKSKN